MIHCVGIGQSAQVGHGALYSSDVVVNGQQSVAQGTVTLETLMICGHTASVGRAAHEYVGQDAMVG